MLPTQTVIYLNWSSNVTNTRADKYGQFLCFGCPSFNKFYRVCEQHTAECLSAQRDDVEDGQHSLEL